MSEPFLDNLLTWKQPPPSQFRPLRGKREDQLPTDIDRLPLLLSAMSLAAGHGDEPLETPPLSRRKRSVLLGGSVDEARDLCRMFQRHRAERGARDQVVHISAHRLGPRHAEYPYANVRAFNESLWRHPVSGGVLLVLVEEVGTIGRPRRRNGAPPRAADNWEHAAPLIEWLRWKPPYCLAVLSTASKAMFAAAERSWFDFPLAIKRLPAAATTDLPAAE